jgi:thioredoxin 1
MSENLLEFSDANFEAEVLNSDVPVVVDFTATWCGPCKKIAPIVDQLAGQYAGQVKAGKLDIDANPNTPVKYRVRGVPTLILFKNGEEANRLIGAVPKKRIEALFT